MNKMMKKIRETARKFLEKIKRMKAAAVSVTALFLLSLRVSAATDIASSKLATGTEKLVKDLTSWMLVLAPIVGGAVVVYCLIRRTISDEMDHKKWNGRIVGAIICTVIAMLASGLLTLLMDYFK